MEALWDGDTVHDWFVTLVAVLEEPAAKATWRPSANGPTAHLPPGPQPTPAGRRPGAGRAPAGHLGVPFPFASPDAPDDDAPRRRSR
ncbi:hypothetical protein [Streptomyces sp. NPDC053367]|uniref:hypothetical protein n=1 Tax=Streptomyces sp. NPDC053367 TaxID=3365700 RepID=UPI0037D5A4F5